MTPLRIKPPFNVITSLDKGAEGEVRQLRRVAGVEIVNLDNANALGMVRAAEHSRSGAGACAQDR